MLNLFTFLFARFKKTTYTTAVLTRTGGRKTNEDRIGWQVSKHQRGFWVLADGVGGNGCGDIAADLVVTTVRKEFPQHLNINRETVRLLLNAIDLGIMDVQQITQGGENMASTGVLLLMQRNQAVWGHIGDSRLYRIHKGQCQCLTKDHTLAQLLVDQGQISAEQILSRPERHQLMQSLGGNFYRMSISQMEKIHTNDVFILCSDGFWEYIQEDDLLNYLTRAQPLQTSLLQLEQALLTRVEQRGLLAHHDNYSALVVKIE